VCYDPYGCYDTNPPWTDVPRRVVEVLPQQPSKLNPKFQLYTRFNYSVPQVKKKKKKRK
jgi:hypothetical protein